MRKILTAVVFLAGVALFAQSAKVPSIAEKTSGMKKLDGFFPLYWDQKAGKLWMEIERWDTDFLYLESLAAGVGSNDIGLDRGQVGDGQVLRFTRVGPKVLLVEPNQRYRAENGASTERRAVEESFASSILWGTAVAAEDDGDRVLVDITPFVMRDAHHVVPQMKRARQGDFRVDESRSAVFPPRTKNFPKNTEMEATLTFTGGPAGPLLSSVSPEPDAFTVRVHQSFVELPPPGYHPRAYDPRAGYFHGSYADYSTPISEPLMKNFISRHRLEKKDPTAAVSDPVQPIVYYLDPGTPEPIRSALLEGARWWSQAFEAAGFRNAFRVEVLPEDADPMDIRYNVIEWVHRSTRGWSYGASVNDPRTGEIIKGMVSLGSLRVRQDFLIAQALLSPYAAGGGTSPEMERMALARLRQLAAHEVGHTLGLAHNYIASTQNRSSVMDYPHPLVKLTADGKIDLSDAYATGIGEWDKVSITWGYSQFAPGTDEKKALDGILDAARKRGLTFLTDIDARPPGSAHPKVHLWDNGTDAVTELTRMLKVRRAALARFGENSIPEGRPMSDLEDTLVPLYLLHRYQLEAAAKVIGGLTYTYSLRGDGQTPTELVPPAEQKSALAAILAAVSPEELVLPEKLLRLLPPRPSGYGRTRESFPSETGMTFDPVATAESAADMAAALLYHPERAARLVEYHARDASQPGLDYVLREISKSTWEAAPRRAGLAGTVQNAVDVVMLRRLLALAANKQASSAVKEGALAEVRRLRGALQAHAASPDASYAAHCRYGVLLIDEFEKDPAKVNLPEAVSTPPGQPIG